MGTFRNLSDWSRGEKTKAIRNHMSCTTIESLINIYLYSAVFRARREPMAPVREGQVKDLVTVFSQCLNLHAGDTVKKTSELSIP